jgi:hypothetical protein
MHSVASFLSIMKAMTLAAAAAALYHAPVWFSNKNGMPAERAKFVRIYGWGLGWTGIGWLVAMFLAVAPAPRD